MVESDGIGVSVASGGVAVYALEDCVGRGVVVLLPEGKVGDRVI